MFAIAFHFVLNFYCQAMSKDKRNTYQHTPKQLRRKCEGLLNSSLLPKYQELFPDVLPEETMDTL